MLEPPQWQAGGKPPSPSSRPGRSRRADSREGIVLRARLRSMEIARDFRRTSTQAPREFPENHAAMSGSELNGTVKGGQFS
jgi:hypothetical protein